MMERATLVRPAAPAAPTVTGLLQRKCTACTTQDEREDEPIQRRAISPGRNPGITAAARAVISTPGRPLPRSLRASIEPLFGADFSRVRVHTDLAAAESARAIAAEAYTVGHDLVFGRDRYAPETHAGRKLLAHELTHVVQQRAMTLSPRLMSGPAEATHERAADAMGERAAASATAPVASRWLVDDEVEQLSPGQMRKSDFLARLRPPVCRAADAQLARVGQDSRGCPYLDRAFAHYADQSAERLERALRLFAPQSARASSAEGMIAPVAVRVGEGVARWADGGELPQLPDGVDLGAVAGAGLFSGLASFAGGVLGGISRLFFKATPGAPTPAAKLTNAAALRSGAPLETGVRQRMAGAFGRELPEVRVHANADAASLNARLGSRAFTLGHHIAFGQGEYQPGTPVGDALLAHELAHVVQQGTPVEPATLPKASLPSLADAALEADADQAAAGAVVSIWGRTQRGLEDLRRKTGPRLKSGLKLQLGSCAGGGTANKETASAMKQRNAATGVVCPSPTGAAPRSDPTPERPGARDAKADAIIDAAGATSVPANERAVAAVTTILCTYFPASVGKVEAVEYRSKLGGLLVESVGTGPNARGRILVGDDFVKGITRVHFARRVLQVGHELQHVDQYRSGMVGEDRGAEREFLARAWTALQGELPGTGRMPDGTRRNLIDGALECFHCLSVEQQESYRDRRDQLLARRERVNGTRGNPKTEPPSACPADGCRP
jgi:hypothetical protein